MWYFKIILEIKTLFICTDTSLLVDIDESKYDAVDIDIIPTLHDFDVIIIDMENLVDKELYNSLQLGTKLKRDLGHDKIKLTISRAVNSGTIVFVFSSKLKRRKRVVGDSILSSYDWLPPEISIIQEYGDTLRINQENISEYKPLFDEYDPENIIWDCYFNKYPENSKVIATNRAGYAIFLEVPFGKGKYVFLPNFLDRQKAINIIVNRIIPQIVRTEDLFDVPKWVRNYSHPIEEKTRRILSEFSKAKQIIYTNDRGTERASALILEVLGFQVNRLPAGTLPDLELHYEDSSAIVEVKGHENRRTNRANIAQILAYESEIDEDVKLIVISNHEFSKSPDERSDVAYTQSAIHLAEVNDISLLNSVDLWKLYLHKKENLLTEEDLEKIRNKILNGKGIIAFDEFYQT